MDKPVYPIDLIAERDAKLKLARTVVKWWNVNFIYPDQVNGEVPQAEAEAAEAAQTDTPFMAEGEVVEETHDTPAEEELTEEQKALIEQANEVFARLEAEKAADEAIKQAEIDAAYAAANGGVTDADYNAATGSYSGAYGKGEVSDETKDLAASILAEKGDAFSDMLNGLTQ